MLPKMQKARCFLGNINVDILIFANVAYVA